MKYNLGFILIPLLILSACKEDPAPTGVTLLPDSDLVDVVRFDTNAGAAPVQTSTYFRANLGETSTTLWLGESGAYKSEIVMLWNNFTEAIGDEGTILETKMVLHTASQTFGGDAGLIAFDVLEISDSIGIGNVSIENIDGIATFAEPRGTYSGTDTSITVPLDSAMVREWMRRFTKNVNASVAEAGPEPYGIKITPKGMNHITGFANGNSIAYSPELIMIVERNGAPDTLRGMLLRDTYVTSGPDISAQPLSVHGGLAYRGRIKFDLSGVPPGSIVNYIKLTLTRSPGNETRGSMGLDSILVYEAMSETVDSTNISSSIGRPTEENPDVYFTEGTINTATLILAVQRWINSPELNFGLILTKLNERTDLDQLNFYGGEADVDKRPRLEVFYTTKP